MKSLRPSLQLLAGAILFVATLLGEPGHSSAAVIFAPVSMRSELPSVWNAPTWTPDGSSMSTSDGPQAIFTNPAAIGLRSGVGTFFGGTLENDRQTLGCFSVQLSSLSFGYLHSNDRGIKPEESAFT